MNTQIRKASSPDVPVLAVLMTEFYREAGLALASEPASRPFMALLDDPGLGAVWVIEADGEPQGYIVLTLAFSMEYGGLRGFIDDFFVRRHLRGKGLGAAALDTVKHACREIGIAALLVETGPADHPARSIYQRAGFQENARVLLSQALAPALHDR